MSRLQEHYKKTVAPALMEKLKLKNPMEVPKISKITINMGVGEAVGDRKVMESATADLARLSGQKAVVTRARKSVASFKIRDGYPIGAKVTLRRERMYEFLDRLVNIAIPRVRDFRGLSAKSFLVRQTCSGCSTMASPATTPSWRGSGTSAERASPRS